jgi:hypothetical protein
MKENQKKSFDFAADTTKQLITLATAIIALSVTFAKDIVGVSSDYPKVLLAWTWSIFIASLFFGIFALMALTGSLQPISDEKKKSDTNEARSPTPETEEQKKARMSDTKKIIEDAASKGIKLEESIGHNFSINRSSIRLWAGLQIFCFVAGIIMTVIFGYRILSNGQAKDNHKDDYMIIRESRLGADSTIYIDTLYLPKK